MERDTALPGVGVPTQRSLAEAPTPVKPHWLRGGPHLPSVAGSLASGCIPRSPAVFIVGLEEKEEEMLVEEEEEEEKKEKEEAMSGPDMAAGLGP